VTSQQQQLLLLLLTGRHVESQRDKPCNRKTAFGTLRAATEGANVDEKMDD
jgi:hypothetical protein